MTARNLKTGEIYEGCRTYIGSIVGVDRVTLWRWEVERLREVEIYNNYEIRFKNVIRKKQNKGFRLRKKRNV